MAVQHSKHVAKSPRTPHTRVPTPDYDLLELCKAMQAYVRAKAITKAFDLGVCEGVSLAQSVRGSGLVFLADLISALTTVSVFVTFKMSDLKVAFKEAADQFEGLCNKSNKDRWATDLSERVMTTLTHLRRLKNSEVRVRQALHKMDEPNSKILRGLVDAVHLLPCKTSSADNLGGCDIVGDADDAAVPIGTGIPGPTVADTSQELSSGIPEMSLQEIEVADTVCYRKNPADPAGPPGSDVGIDDEDETSDQGSLAAEAASCPAIAGDKLQLKAAMLLLKRPAGAKKRPAAAGRACKKDPVTPTKPAKPAEPPGADPGTTAETPAKAKLFTTYAKDKSYIQIKDVGSPKKLLVIGCTKTQSREHSAVIKIIFEELSKKNGLVQQSARNLAGPLRHALLK